MQLQLATVSGSVVGPIASGVYRVGASMRVDLEYTDLEYTEMVLTADVAFYTILALLLTGFAWHLNIPETNFYARWASL